MKYRNTHEKGLVEMGGPGAELMPFYSTVTFGALMEGPGLKRVDNLTLRSAICFFGYSYTGAASMYARMGDSEKANSAPQGYLLRWVSARDGDRAGLAATVHHTLPQTSGRWRERIRAGLGQIFQELVDPPPPTSYQEP